MFSLGIKITFFVFGAEIWWKFFLEPILRPSSEITSRKTFAIPHEKSVLRLAGRKGVWYDFEYTPTMNKTLLNINMCSSHKILKSFIALYGVTFWKSSWNFAEKKLDSTVCLKVYRWGSKRVFKCFRTEEKSGFIFTAATLTYESLLHLVKCLNFTVTNSNLVGEGSVRESRWEKVLCTL